MTRLWRPGLALLRPVLGGGGWRALGRLSRFARGVAMAPVRRRGVARRGAVMLPEAASAVAPMRVPGRGFAVAGPRPVAGRGLAVVAARVRPGLAPRAVPAGRPVPAASVARPVAPAVRREVAGMRAMRLPAAVAGAVPAAAAAMPPLPVGNGFRAGAMAGFGAVPRPGLPAMAPVGRGGLRAVGEPGEEVSGWAGEASVAEGARGGGGGGAGRANGGDVILDGMKVGRWMARELTRQAGGPQSGFTGFDIRTTPAWPGALQGGAA